MSASSAPSCPDGTLCVVQARMGSTRLPGKVLADLGGRPMLAFMLERLAGLDARVVIATSDLERDAPIAELGERLGVGVVRGDEADVLSRFAQALDEHPSGTVVRLTGDCPLVDPGLVRDVLARHHGAGADYTSNVLPRSFPKGLDVEVCSASALRAAHAEAIDPAEREHVTPFLYRRPERFRLANARSGEDRGAERWTVDTPEDLEAVRRLVGDGDVALDWRALPRRVPLSGADDGLRLRPAAAGDADAVLAWRNEPDAVAFSRTRSAVDPQAHAAWWSRRFDDPGTRLRIATLDGRRVGMARADVTAGVGEVSLAVGAEHRGHGLGTRILELLAADCLQDQQVVALQAAVDPRNEASVRTFTRAGFRHGTHAPDGFTILTRPIREPEPTT